MAKEKDECVRHLAKNNKNNRYHAACGTRIISRRVHPLCIVEEEAFLIKSITCKKCQETLRYKYISAIYTARILQGLTL